MEWKTKGYRNKWYPIGRKKGRGRVKTILMDGIRGMMKEIGHTGEDWVDKENWR